MRSAHSLRRHFCRAHLLHSVRDTQTHDNPIRTALRLLWRRWKRRVLLSTYGVSDVGFFSSNSTGANPESALVMDSKGNLYGTASTGGTNDGGTVFEIASGSNAMTGLASFNGADGSMPVAGVTLDSAGDLFGTTYSGGANNDGTVFEIAHGSNTITTLAALSDANAANPTGGITLDAAGKSLRHGRARRSARAEGSSSRFPRGSARSRRSPLFPPREPADTTRTAVSPLILRAISGGRPKAAGQANTAPCSRSPLDPAS